MYLWEKVSNYLKNSPSKLSIVHILLKYGLKITEDGKICLDEVEIPDTKIAKVCGAERRAIRETVKFIRNEPELAKLFERLKPAGASLEDIAYFFGYGILKIHADPKVIGVISSVTTLLAKENIGIMQIISEDPSSTPNPMLVIITDQMIPGKLLSQFLSIKGIRDIIFPSTV